MLYKYKIGMIFTQYYDQLYTFLLKNVFNFYNTFFCYVCIIIIIFCTYTYITRFIAVPIAIKLLRSETRHLQM